MNPTTEECPSKTNEVSEPRIDCNRLIVSREDRPYQANNNFKRFLNKVSDVHSKKLDSCLKEGMGSRNNHVVEHLWLSLHSQVYRIDEVPVSSSINEVRK